MLSVKVRKSKLFMMNDVKNMGGEGYKEGNAKMGKSMNVYLNFP